MHSVNQKFKGCIGSVGDASGISNFLSFHVVMEFTRKFLQDFPESSMFVRLTCIQINAKSLQTIDFGDDSLENHHEFRGFRSISSTWSKSMVTWYLENPILDSYSAPMTKNSERFQPFKLDVCWILEIELLRFGAEMEFWNLNLEGTNRVHISPSEPENISRPKKHHFYYLELKTHSWSASKCRKLDSKG